MHSTTDADVRAHEVPIPTVPRHVSRRCPRTGTPRPRVPAVIWLAAQSAAPVLLLGVVIDAAFVESRRNELEDIADELRARGLEVETLVRRSDEVAWTIVEEARLRAGSVICMPTHGPGRLVELAIGTVTQDVVDHAPGPVVLVGPQAQTLIAPRRFVVAADDTPASSRAVWLAGDWARAFGADVELVEVLDPHVDEQVDRADVLESATLQGYATGLRAHGIEPSWEVLHGRNPGAAIVRHVADRPDAFVVVGTNARHGIPRLAQGSVAMQIVHGSPVPVVVVR